MEKRYQVFVSSTYEDLADERNEIMQALLELECMPSGMELFPAANETQWNWIKKVIIESDYYIIIIGGRYGSIHPDTGLSYTEMEYRFAVESEIPVIGFLHSDPDQLSAKKSESDPESRKKLAEFRKLVRSRLCKFYTTPEDLGAKVSRSLVQLKKQYPAIGWVRADTISNLSNSDDVLKLMKENAELKKKLESYTKSIISDKSLANSDDIYEVEITYSVRQGGSSSGPGKKISNNTTTCPLTIDKIFSIIGPTLLKKQNFYFSDPLSDYIKENYKGRIQENHIDNRIQDIKVTNNCLERIYIHFKALNLINWDGKNWRLTETGDKYLINLMALRK